jgi:UDP-N-acetyl-alpha-D-quinovosamine dehydrogenase
MSVVLVTGASGFIGRELCVSLSREGHDVRAALRKPAGSIAGATDTVVVGEIGAGTDWGAALRGVEAVVHCAGRAHMMNERNGDAQRYMETNVHGTEGLTRACLEAGVRRLVFLSSIKVNGERTCGQPFSPADRPQPLDPYGESKLAAENSLTAIAAESSLDTAIVRLPLVYGPHVRANFLRLLRAVERGIPLPLARVKNSRSLVSVWNLCDLIERLLHDGGPRHAVFMVSDGEDLSTPELVKRIAAHMDRPLRLVPVPVAALRVAAAVTGRMGLVERLCGSLTVNISETRRMLGWTPPVSTEEGLARTVRWFMSAE